jgi:hypothetical protein
LQKGLNLFVTTDTKLSEKFGEAPVQLNSTTTVRPEELEDDDDENMGQFVKPTTEEERRFMIVRAMNQDQRERYEQFRKSKFNASHIKNIMTQAVGSERLHINKEMEVFVCGVAKVFVGEIVEEALAVAGYTEVDHKPLLPKHIREAVRRLQSRGKIGPNRFGYRRKVFRR